ncbi:uncharacterized protein [Lolium perenne]|uniref:uncharacterized protein n=1 Tax=Lolium perenne TaxID=4522 RepID=UPI0021F51CA8|nr:uncharacterized protein LOC127340208 [Lolium perenne]
MKFWSGKPSSSPSPRRAACASASFSHHCLTRERRPDPIVRRAGVEDARLASSRMTTPPEGGVGAAERVRATADDPVREVPDAAVLSGALCRVGDGAMFAACGKYSGSSCPQTCGRKPYWQSVSSTERPYHQARRPTLLKRPPEGLSDRASSTSRSRSKCPAQDGLSRAFSGRLLSSGVISARRSLARDRICGPGGGGTAKQPLETCQPCGNLHCTTIRRPHRTLAASSGACFRRCRRHGRCAPSRRRGAWVVVRVEVEDKREVRADVVLREAADAH